jgi:hypothetical protein
MQTNHSSYKPEDFWPEAEQMLDRHFARKARWRRFRVLGWGFLLLLMGGGIWFLARPETGKDSIHLPKPLAETQVPQQSAKADEAQPSSENSVEQGSQHITHSSPAPSGAPMAISSQTTTYTVEAGRELEQLSGAASPKGKDKPKQTAPLSEQAQVTSSNPHSPIALANHGKGTTVNESAHRATHTSAREDAASVATVSKAQRSAAKGTTTNAVMHVNPNSEALSTHHAGLQTAAKVKVARTAVELPALRSKAVQLELPEVAQNPSEPPAIAASLLNWDRVVAQAQGSKPNQHFRVEVQMGVMQQQHTLQASESYDYMRKPSNQKSWSLNQEVLGIYERGRFLVGAGWGQSGYRAKLDVRPEVWGWIQQIESNTELINDTQVVTRYYWVQGNEYQELVNIITTDSIIVNDTLISQGWKSGALPEPMASHNVYSYWEIPLQLGYQMRLHSRWNVMLRGGVRYGMLRRAEGIVPNTDYSAWESLSTNSGLRKSIWSTQLGIRLSYAPHVRWECYMQPEYRQTTSSIWNATMGVDERFQSWGIQAGVSYRFGN